MILEKLFLTIDSWRDIVIETFVLLSAKSERKVNPMPRKSEIMPERLVKIIHYVNDYSTRKGMSPTIREIGDYLGIGSTSHVKHYLLALRSQERISWTANVARSFRVTASQQAEHVVNVRWWGYIAGGRPISTPDQADFSAYPDRVVSVLMSMLGPNDPEKLFALTVKGDSMLDANISDGDTVIFKPTQVAGNGDMVAVWLAEENTTTLKYFHRDAAGIVLKPANPAYKPIIVDRPEQVRIQGKVVAVIRKMDQI
jgi:repressor LexA